MNRKSPLLTDPCQFVDFICKQQREDLYGFDIESSAPKIALISCGVSLFKPSVILDCEQDDVFDIPNNDNFECYDTGSKVDQPYSALEFAVKILKVETIIVLGHTFSWDFDKMLGMQLYSTPKKFVDEWMKQLESFPEESAINDSQLHDYKKRAITISLNKLHTVPWISSRIDTGKLRMHGWFYDLAKSELYSLQEASGAFRKIN